MYMTFSLLPFLYFYSHMSLGNFMYKLFYILALIEVTIEKGQEYIFWLFGL